MRKGFFPHCRGPRTAHTLKIVKASCICSKKETRPIIIRISSPYVEFTISFTQNKQRYSYNSPATTIDFVKSVETTRIGRHFGAVFFVVKKDSNLVNVSRTISKQLLYV